jgi:tetratricopeptide (TPR) repeat protein
MLAQIRIQRNSEMRHLTIDCSAERASLQVGAKSRVFRRKWVALYAALAFHRLADDRALVLSATELRQYGSWFNIRPASVGKMVAAHLKELSQSGLGDVLVHVGKTKGWRLELAPNEISLLPSEGACRLWLDDQTDHLEGIALVPVVLTEWLTKMIRAFIRLQEGSIDEGVRLCREARQHTDSILLKAIAELVEIRLHARHAQYPEEWPNLALAQGRIGEALRVRAELSQALQPGMANAELVLEDHRRRIVALERLPDVNAIGIAYNVAGVLSRRSGRFDEAARHLRYAVALLVASFDLPTLQAAVFNLGHTLYKAAEGDEGLKLSRETLMLARELLDALGLGRDFAQGEVVLGLISLKLGRLDEAERWLQEAKRIASTLGSDYDQAEVELLQARIRWVRSWDKAATTYADPEIIAGYRRARELLMSVGFSGADVVEEEKLYRRGVRPLWLAVSE